MAMINRCQILYVLDNYYLEKLLFSLHIFICKMGLLITTYNKNMGKIKWSHIST